MDPSAGPVDKRLARMQWQQIVGHYTALGVEVYFLEPKRELIDQCFTANVAWVCGRRVYLANFSYRERHLERLVASEWFESHPYVRAQALTVEDTIPGDIVFEGGGDATSIPGGPILVGYGQRSHKRAVHAIRSREVADVVGLRLIDPRFYHLDTCLLVIPAIETLLYFPGAFDEASLEAIAALPYQALPISEEDAMRFVANGVAIRDSIVVNEPTVRLRKTLEREGLTIVSVDTSEFMKSGGSIRCLTLALS